MSTTLIHGPPCGENSTLVSSDQECCSLIIACAPSRVERSGLSSFTTAARVEDPDHLHQRIDGFSDCLEADMDSVLHLLMGDEQHCWLDAPRGTATGGAPTGESVRYRYGPPLQGRTTRSLRIWVRRV